MFVHNAGWVIHKNSHCSEKLWNILYNVLKSQHGTLGITPSQLFVYYYTFLLYKTVFFSISLCTFPCQMEGKVKSLKSVLSFFFLLNFSFFTFTWKMHWWNQWEFFRIKLFINIMHQKTGPLCLLKSKKKYAIAKINLKIWSLGNCFISRSC